MLAAAAPLELIFPEAAAAAAIHPPSPQTKTTAIAQTTTLPMHIVDSAAAVAGSSAPSSPLTHTNQNPTSDEPDDDIDALLQDDDDDDDEGGMGGAAGRGTVQELLDAERDSEEQPDAADDGEGDNEVPESASMVEDDDGEADGESKDPSVVDDAAEDAAEEEEPGIDEDVYQESNPDVADEHDDDMVINVPDGDEDESDDDQKGASDQEDYGDVVGSEDDAPRRSGRRGSADAGSRRKTRIRKQPYNAKGQRVYCICRDVDDGRFMISCDICKDWYHGECVDVTEEEADGIKSYKCPICVENEAEEAAIAKSRLKRQEQDRAAEIKRRAAAAATGSGASKSKKTDLKLGDFPNHSAKAKAASAAARSKSGGSKSKSRTAVPTIPSTSFSKSSSKPGGASAHASRSNSTDAFVTDYVDVGPDCREWEKDKVRVAVRKQFTETFKGVLADPDLAGDIAKARNGELELSATTSTPPGDADGSGGGGAARTGPAVMDPIIFAAQVEDEMFDEFSDGARGLPRACGDKYKAKFRSLQFNLKDKKNTTLRSRLATSLISAAVLVRLNHEDLANDEIKAKAEQIRIEGIRNSIKPKDSGGGGLYKKTHKGDEAIGGDGFGVIAIEKVSSVKEEDRTVYGVPAKSAVARLAAAALVEGGGSGAGAGASGKSLEGKSGRASSAPRNSLDELLAKIGGGRGESKPSSVLMGGGRGGLGTKRSMFDDDGDEYDVGGGGKRARNDDADYSSSYGYGVGDDTSGFMNSGSAAVAMDVDLVGWGAGDGIDDAAGLEPSTPPFSPPHSPSDEPPPPPEETDESAPVWAGTVRMAAVGWFTGQCRQVAGRRIGGRKVWEDIVPPAVSIEGRVAHKSAQDYVGLQRESRSKEVVVVEFTPNEDDGATGGVGEGASSTAVTTSAKAGFDTLFSYFAEKQRYAVVGQNYISVKDMYLVPVRADEVLPPFIQVLKGCTAEVERRERDVIYGVIILDRSIVGSITGNAASKGSKPTRDSGRASAAAAASSGSKPVSRVDPRKRPEPATQRSAMRPPPPQPMAPLPPPPAVPVPLPVTAPAIPPYVAPLVSQTGGLPPPPPAPAAAANLLASLAALRNAAPLAGMVPPPPPPQQPNPTMNLNAALGTPGVAALLATLTQQQALRSLQAGAPAVPPVGGSGGVQQQAQHQMQVQSLLAQLAKGAYGAGNNGR